MKAAVPSWLAAALLGAGSAAGAILQTCPSRAGGVCYSIAVPTSSADAGSGNIYFQITAPTTFQWVALGTGTGMSGSNIFVMYQDGKGNLTLSPRLGQGHFMPMLDTSSTAAKLTLLDGSGVSSDGNTMTANVACANCQAWSGGGSMSLKSTSAAWIGAWKEGSSLATTSRSASINQHDDNTAFRVDLTRATVSSDSNPFTASRDSAGGSGSGSNSGGNSGGNSNGGGNGNGNGGSSSGGDSDSGNGIVTSSGPSNTVLVAHGVIMAMVMAALYPLGALLMPLVRKWWLHGAWQALSFILMWVGFGLGVVTAKERDELFNQTHTICGTVVVCLLAIQPALGVLHHVHYLKTNRRGLISYVHIWWGRALMALGVVNGGLGLQLAGAGNGPVIAYGVVAGVVFVGYAAFKVRDVVLRRREGGGAGGSLGGGVKEAGTPPVGGQQQQPGAYAQHEAYPPQQQPYSDERGQREFL